MILQNDHFPRVRRKVTISVILRQIKITNLLNKELSAVHRKFEKKKTVRHIYLSAPAYLSQF